VLHALGIIGLILLLVIALGLPSRSGDSPMVARLGNVIYWAASILAAVVILLAAYAAFFGTGEGRLLLDATLGAMGVGVWLVGRACRYVLAGR
jgi:uncharacterized membrane protein